MNRRRFVEAALAPALMRAATAAPIRYGVIGSGQRGRAHLARLRDRGGDARIVAIADIDGTALGLALKDCASHSPRGYRDHRELLANSQVDAVIVATPNYLHREHAVACFEAGKHVLCEKPLATTVADARGIVEAARKANRVLLPGHELRFARVYGELMRALPRVGAVRQILHEELRGDWFAGSWKYEGKNWRWLDKPSGGTMIEKSLHFVDLFQMILGQRPLKVQREGGVSFYRDGRETWDHATITLSYRDGVSATHVLSMFHQPVRNQLRVLGERGVLEVQGHSRLSHYAYGKPAEVLYDSHAGETGLAVMHSGDPEMHSAFAAAIRGEAKLPFEVSVAVDAVAASLGEIS